MGDFHSSRRVSCAASPHMIRRFCSSAGRPSLDDVQRIASGKAARKRGVGSRAVPHRLNTAEMKSFDVAKRTGFVCLNGSGWRRHSSASGVPLLNTFRNWCDANALPTVSLHRGDHHDEVRADLSTLRAPSDNLEFVASACMHSLPGAHDGVVEAISREGMEDIGHAAVPTHQLPKYVVSWSRNDRSEAKLLAKAIVRRFTHPDKPRILA